VFQLVFFLKTKTLWKPWQLWKNSQIRVEILRDRVRNSKKRDRTYLRRKLRGIMRHVNGRRRKVRDAITSACISEEILRHTRASYNHTLRNSLSLSLSSVIFREDRYNTITQIAWRSVDHRLEPRAVPSIIPAIVAITRPRYTTRKEVGRRLISRATSTDKSTPIASPRQFWRIFLSIFITNGYADAFKRLADRKNVFNQSR